MHAKPSAAIGDRETTEPQAVIPPVEFVLHLLGSKWTVPILYELADRTRRTNELMESLSGISSKTLTQRLRTLEDCGLVVRRVYPEVPPHVEYSLTDRGREAIPLMQALARVGARWLGLQEDCAPSRSPRDSRACMAVVGGTDRPGAMGSETRDAS